MFLEKTDLPVSDYALKELFLSKMDKDGESDITVVIEMEGRRYALLIEDKIDALAMPDQQFRYTTRGDKVIAKQEYDEYRDFSAV